ncbi:MAG: hypothetical protein HW417_1954 [Steroidobacteraceae bacterium]|nr:hypothetical protein [Steroidobacteraceae bacterium]MBM2855026.1 hypothetical protein [Steroidobacteraceae bacterium]
MTTRPMRGIELAEVDEAAVASYLSATPEFFDRHAQLLAKIRLPDSRGGATTVSLLERQVEVLRERNRQLERKLKEYVDVARENDTLGARVLTMARRLIAAGDRVAVIKTVEASLREDFDAGESVLVLTQASVPAGVAESRFLRVVAADAPDLRSFETLFSSGKPRCGQLRDSQRDFLFGAGSVAIGSVALVPLGLKGHLGLLACGSSDSERFNPTMSTDFLQRIGELIAAALAED